MESAINSRLTNEARMPSVPMVSPSEMAMVLNSMGVPPAARMPSFTFAESRRRWKLHGMVSIQVLATPINGRLRSASVNPMALNMERAGARSRPSVIPRLGCFRSMDERLQQRSGFEQCVEIAPEKRGTLVQTTTPIRRISTSGSPNRYDVAQEWTSHRPSNPKKLKPKPPVTLARPDSQKPADAAIPNRRPPALQ